jgi:hypothetical protein
MSELLTAGQPLLHGFKHAAQRRKRRRRIEAAAPAAESGRIGDAIRIFQSRRGAFPRAGLDKTSPERLTRCDQAVMGVGQRENGKESERKFAEIAEPAAVLDPVVTGIMRLLAPPAMTDNRIPQTEGTPAKDLFRTSHRPVEARLAMVRRKWNKGNRTALEGSLAGRNLARICARKKSLPPSRLISANRRINLLLRWPPRIGRLTAGQ